MTEWLAARSQRERAMLVAALIAFAFTALLILFGRLDNMKSDALGEVKRASQTLDRINSLQPARVSDAATPSKTDVDEARREILGLATTRGLEVSEVRLETGKHVSVQLDEAPSDLIFAWLIDLDTKAGIRVSHASMTEVGGGLVRSRFEFAVAGPP